jgi:hypothetical protein
LVTSRSGDRVQGSIVELAEICVFPRRVASAPRIIERGKRKWIQGQVKIHNWKKPYNHENEMLKPKH